MNTKKFLIVLTLLVFSTPFMAQWKPAGDKIKTKWAQKIDPENVWPEYPRPIMERPDWKNLNGLWEYAIQARGKALPEKFDGEILVPFPAESSLSGVMKGWGPKTSFGTAPILRCPPIGTEKTYCCILVRWIGRRISG